MAKQNVSTAKKTKPVKTAKKVKCPLKDLEYGEKSENYGK